MRANRGAIAKPWWLLPIGRLNSSWWYGIAACLIVLDYSAGPTGRFPVLYLIPVVLAAWYSGRRPALAIAVAVPLVHIGLLAAVWTPPNLLALVAATLFRAAIIIFLAVWFARLAEHERDLQGYVLRLEGLLPICSFCKSIRNTTGDWETLETYISHRSEAQFSHGLCPNCGKTHYPDFDLDGVPPDRVDMKH